jgi:hypothetical protein
MTKVRFLVFTCIIAAVSLTGCAKPPVEEMDAATAAVSRAENDPDVINYASSALSRARESLAQMQAAADAKRYDEAKRLAADAQTLAEKALNDGKAAVQRVKSEADNAVRAMQDSIVETERLLNGASRSRPAGVNIDQLEKDFENARGTASEAVEAQSGNRYSEAIEKSQTVRSALSSITSRLSQTVISASRKK